MINHLAPFVNKLQMLFQDVLIDVIDGAVQKKKLRIAVTRKGTIVTYYFKIDTDSFVKQQHIRILPVRRWMSIATIIN
jgi:hypothetical protein